MSCGQNHANTKHEEQVIVNLSPKEFLASIEGKEVVLLDLRTPEELHGGIIKGATHLDYFGDSFEEKLKNLNVKQSIFLYCQSGGRSGDAAEKLEKMGAAKVYNLDGGIESWEDVGLTLVAH